MLVIPEIKLHLKSHVLIRNGTCGKPTYRNIKWHVPPVVHFRMQGKPDLSYNLKKQVKRNLCIFPFFNRQNWTLNVPCKTGVYHNYPPKSLPNYDVKCSVTQLVLFNITRLSL